MVSNADYHGLRVAFAGTPDFAATHLDALLAAKANIVAVYTQPDRPAGRGKKCSPSPVKALAQQHQLPVFQPQTLKDTAAQATFTQHNADVFIVVAYGLIIPQTVLDTPTYGCINVHGSLLPRWRGAAPIQRAIEAGDLETGITIMQMDIGLDTGAMLKKVVCPINNDDTGGSLHNKLAEMGPPALIDTLNLIARQQLNPQQQDDSASCYAHKISKQEADLNWQQSATDIGQKIRAFNPFPVCYSQIGGATVRLWQAEVVTASESNRSAAGTIVKTSNQGLIIACGEGYLCVSHAQLPGKKPLAIADILRGNPTKFTAGDQFSRKNP